MFLSLNLIIKEDIGYRQKRKKPLRNTMERYSWIRKNNYLKVEEAQYVPDWQVMHMIDEITIKKGNAYKTLDIIINIFYQYRIFFFLSYIFIYNLI